MLKKIIKLENWIYLTILVLPFYLVKIKISFLPTNGLEIIIGLVCFLYLLEKKRWPNLKNYKKYIIFISLIFLGLGLATLLNSSPLKGLNIIKSWFLEPIILMLIIGSVFPAKKIINIYWTFYISAFLVASIALGYLFLGKVTYDGRLTAFFNSPNYLAMYLAPALIIALVEIQEARDKKRNRKIEIGLFFSLTIILSAFYFTYSYATWLAVILTALILFFFQKKISFKKVTLISLIIILLLFSQVRNDKFRALISLNARSSLASRIIIWRSAEKMLQNNWLWGIGPGNFQKVYLDYQKFYPPYLNWAVPHPHNLYLAFWLYGGISSLIGFMGLLFFWFYDVSRKIKKTGEPVLWIALGIMLVILIHGLVDTTYFKNDLAIIFWLNFLVLKF